MKVWVVVFDFGLNGAEVGPVAYRTEAEAQAVAPGLENNLDDIYTVRPRRSMTGYGGWTVAEVEVAE